MQQPHILTREQADASLARFLADLGHDGADPLSLSAAPRLSGSEVHETLGETVARLRARDIAQQHRHARPHPARVKVRLVRRRCTDAVERFFDLAMTGAVVGIGGFVILPALVTIAARAL